MTFSSKSILTVLINAFTQLWYLWLILGVFMIGKMILNLSKKRRPAKLGKKGHLMVFNFLKLKNEDFRTTKGFVAIFDILGYGAWVDDTVLLEVWMRQMNIKEMIRVNVENFINYSIKRQDRLIISVISYADTFLIYTSEISDDSFKALMVGCQMMFIAADTFSLPIRGATACGEFYVSDTKDVIIGKPIIEAYKNERKQDWIGCWITGECLDKISKEANQYIIGEKMIIKYPIPFKEGAVREDVYAYNLLYNMPPEFINDIETTGYLQKKKTHRWQDERKHKHTKEFLNYILTH